MSRNSLILLGVATAIATLSAASTSPLPLAGGTFQQPETVSLTGAKVGIWNLAGTVTVLPADAGSAVVVEIARHGKDGARITSAHDVIEGVQALRLQYPETHIVYRMGSREHNHWNTELRVRDDGTFDNDDRGRGDRRVSLSGEGDGMEGWADLTVRVPRGQRITIHLAVGSISAENVDGDVRLDTDDGDITASKMKGALSLDTGSGDVKVTGSDGDLSIDTGSGDVTASDLKGRELTMDTGSGAVTVEGAVADALSIDTGSGDVGVSGLDSRDVKVDTGSGGVELNYDAAPSDIDIDTGSGTVRISAPAGLSARIDFETSSGTITSDFPVTLTSHERDELHGTIGDGKGHLHVETGSGEIELRRK
ncbi:MAG: DUF4097 family beta strand repeat-containing protein [Gemmatimonadales bacterium]